MEESDGSLARVDRPRSNLEGSCSYLANRSCLGTLRKVTQPRDESRVDDVVFVREDDPRCADLEGRGYAITGYSWGANLRFDDDSDLSPIQDRVESMSIEGLIIRELLGDDLVAVVVLESANAIDYPSSPAARHGAPSVESLTAQLDGGARAWGALVFGELVAATLVAPHDERWNTEFTSVLPAFRGNGIGAAVKAASIVALYCAGVRWFSTGGAETNSASLGANVALGYVLEPRWRTYSRRSPAAE
jgi:GNAT superfamily N-acetyltransferase